MKHRPLYEGAIFQPISMGDFSKIGVFPPKWMVKIMENPLKMDDLGGFHPPFKGNTRFQ